MAGSSGFTLFGTTDHGVLLPLAGQKRKGVQYVVGNPLIAIQMTRHSLAAGLYAPLRVLVYEDDLGRTCLEYDSEEYAWSDSSRWPVPGQGGRLRRTGSGLAQGSERQG